MGLEAMAQVSMALGGWSQPPMFEQVKFQHPVVVPETERVTIRLAALRRAPDCVEVVLRSEQSDFKMDHFRAICRVALEAESAAGPSSLPADAADVDTVLPLAPDRDLYGKILFQSGRFRRLAGYRQLRTTECVAEIAAGRRMDWFSQYLPASLSLGDPGARDAALHAVQACVPHGTLLPIGVDRLIVRKQVETPLLVCARELSHEGDTFVYDLEVTEKAGGIVERWEGLRLRQVGREVSTEAWSVPLLGPYIERRLGELTEGPKMAVVVQSNGASDRHDRSQSAIRTAVGDSAVVRRRPDGKPDACAGRDISAAHTGNLTVAVAGRGPVACDAEPVVARSADDWRDLLGNDRYELAELISEHASEDRNIAATRVWTAVECLQKAGVGLNGPLLFHSTTADHWVLLSAAALSIATWVGPVQDTEEMLAFSVLEESYLASV
jgi:enediyne polyketide synthase